MVKQEQLRNPGGDSQEREKLFGLEAENAKIEERYQDRMKKLDDIIGEISGSADREDWKNDLKAAKKGVKAAKNPNDVSFLPDLQQIALSIEAKRNEIEREKISELILAGQMENGTDTMLPSVIRRIKEI